MSAVLEELQEQLLTWERYLDSRDGTNIVWEDGIAASECALGRAYMEYDAEHTHTKVVQQDYLARSCDLTSNSKHSNFRRMLEECQILLSL
jgi:hypothetical protein